MTLCPVEMKLVVKDSNLPNVFADFVRLTENDIHLARRYEDPVLITNVPNLTGNEESAEVCLEEGSRIFVTLFYRSDKINQAWSIRRTLRVVDNKESFDVLAIQTDPSDPDSRAVLSVYGVVRD